MPNYKILELLNLTFIHLLILSVTEGPRGPRQELSERSTHQPSVMLLPADSIKQIVIEIKNAVEGVNGRSRRKKTIVSTPAIMKQINRLTHWLGGNELIRRSKH